MGKLGGFSYREVARRLHAFGFSIDRQCKGSHELWRHSAGGRKAIVPNHSPVPEGTLRSILKQAGIDVEEFLKA